MNKIKLNMLGFPFVSDGTKNSMLRFNTPNLALMYLAYKKDWVSREELAFLFRPDDSQANALKYLRMVLYRAKNLDWTVKLESTRKAVRFDLPTDVQDFKVALARQDWATAKSVYDKPFLADYSAKEFPTYNAWLELERSDLEFAYKDALMHYAAALEVQGSHDYAAQVLANLLEVDSLNEDGLRAYLRNTYLANRRDKALKTYDDFRKELQTEYGAVPLEETQALVRLIRNNETLGKALSSEQIVVTQHVNAAHHLPLQSTHFIGRKNDLTKLSHLLQDEKCRHLSIIGLGGMGKTRLAIALAQQQQASFTDGLIYISLARLSNRQAVINELAQQLRLTLTLQEEPLKQIEKHLSSKNLLLIFDNFEHLLEAKDIISTLLEACLHLKILITSRQRLKLRSEWVYDLEGLSLPPSTNHENMETFDAIKLFINSAKRVRPKLELSQDELRAAASICSQVEGSPLAIELAASWVKMMPVWQIEQELRESFALLDTAHSDVEPRHRNMRMLWEKTWTQLSERKRETLAKFTVFQGGSTLEAAEEVTKSHFSLLLSLVNESLLKHVPPNRFEMHELLKQFAATKLTDSFDLTQSTHARVYTEFAAKNSASLVKKKLSENFLKDLERDFPNLQVAWWHLIAQEDYKSLIVLQSAIGYMLFTMARYKESIGFYKESIKQLKMKAPSAKNLIFTANIHSYLSEALMPLGQWDDAQNYLQEGLRLLADQEALVERSNLFESSARIYYFKAQYEEAKKAMLHAYELVKNTNNTPIKTHKLHGLAIILKQLKDYTAAETYYYQALHHYQEIDDLFNSALTLDNLAALKMDLGDLDAAQELLKEALALNQKVSSQRGEANILYTMGGTYYKQKNYLEAKNHLLQALSLAEKVTDNTLLTSIKFELAKTHIKLNNLEDSRTHLLQSAKLAPALNSPAQVHEIILTYAQYLHATNNAETSLPYLAQVLNFKDLQSYSLIEAQELKAQLPKHLQDKLEHQSAEDKLGFLMAGLLDALQD